MSHDLSQSRILYCLAIYLLHFTTSALIIGFTSPDSLIRLAALPLHLAYAWTILAACLGTAQPTFWTALLGGSIVGWTLQFIEVVLLSRWSFDPPSISLRNPEDQAGKRDNKTPRELVGFQNDTRWNRLRYGYYVVFSFRHSGTPYEVKNVPPFSHRDPHYIPTKATFLLQTACSLFLCFTILDVAGLAEQDPSAFSQGSIPIFSGQDRLTTKQLMIRFASSVAFWVSLYCFLVVIQGIAAFISVFSGLNTVKAWRPAFGPLGEAYSIRQFWGVFWHQHNRQKFVGITEFIAHNLLRIPRGLLLARYTKIFLTFLISGLMHAASDLLVGMTWQQSGAVQFFCTQAMGIFVEDGVQATYRFFKGSQRTSAVPEPWVRWLGYTWVLLFMTWSTPVWFYPTVVIHSGNDKPGVLPFSFIKWLRE